jgi:hypothetical protein
MCKQVFLTGGRTCPSGGSAATSPLTRGGVGAHFGAVYPFERFTESAKRTLTLAILIGLLRLDA